ncbi:MAG: hypothetical protein Q8O99_01250 [bacterium]|nr:hypothetical protein [bacterium]
MHRRHSRALKRFIYLLIAMTIFSAVGVMVIYLNISPTAPVIDTTIPVTTEQQLIDIP